MSSETMGSESSTSLDDSSKVWSQTLASPKSTSAKLATLDFGGHRRAPPMSRAKVMGHCQRRFLDGSQGREETERLRLAGQRLEHIRLSSSQLCQGEGVRYHVLDRSLLLNGAFAHQTGKWGEPRKLGPFWKIKNLKHECGEEPCMEYFRRRGLDCA